MAVIFIRSNFKQINIRIYQQWHQGFLQMTNNQQFETFKNGLVILSWAPLQNYSYSEEFKILVAIKRRMAYVFHCSENGYEQLQIISSPYRERSVMSLYYMKQSNIIVMGDYDGNIIIWKFKEDSKIFQIQYFLDDHLNPSNTLSQILTMNRAENLIIQSKQRGRVNFWLKKDDTWNLNQWKQFSNSQISSLELSPDEKTIIIFDGNGNIIVSQQNEDQKWMKKQLICFEQDLISWNISFCQNNIFGLRPIRKNPQILVFFKQNLSNGLYEVIESYSLKSQNYRQQQLYVEEKKLKSITSNELNIENKEFGLIQSIFFMGQGQWGAVFENGKKIISQNVRTQQFLFWQQPNN